MTQISPPESVTEPGPETAGRPDRPAAIAHWTEVEGPDENRYDDDPELLAIEASLARHFGLARLGIHHERLPPGRRTSFPHAESAEEEFVFVIEGTPDAWIDGHLHRLRPGDAVGFPSGTGIAHTFINDTEEEARVLVVGETAKDEDRLIYPLHPDRPRDRRWLWTDPPARERGPHDGLSARARGGPPPSPAGTAPRPAFVRHWTEVEGPDDSRYPGLDETFSVNAPIGDRLGLTRLGIHHERLPPGRRTSLPHAESLEEEFVFVLAGTPDVWLDGTLHRLRPGDAVGFPAGTGLAHTFINDGDAEASLLVVGDRIEGNRVVYPLHPQARGYMDRFWEDAPARPLGGHDGMPKAVRAARVGSPGS